jgi:hypothetical protein
VSRESHPNAFLKRFVTVLPSIVTISPHVECIYDLALSTIVLLNEFVHLFSGGECNRTSPIGATGRV